MQPAVEEPDEIPVSDPRSRPEAVIKEPEEVIEPEPEAQQEPAPEPKPSRSATPADTEGGEQQEIHSPVTGGGSPFAGATIDNVTFNYPYWFTQAFNKILRNWRNPVAADGAIVCVVYFQVIKSGRVIESKVQVSSGIRPFDDACLRAVERSAPFPELPRDFRDEIIGITLPFKYEPR